MIPSSALVVAAVAWQNFYILCGTAAATLIGLMFVAVTFGASLISESTTTSVRAFVDPALNHFVDRRAAKCRIDVLSNVRGRSFKTTMPPPSNRRWHRASRVVTPGCHLSM